MLRILRKRTRLTVKFWHDLGKVRSSLVGEYADSLPQFVECRTWRMPDRSMVTQRVQDAVDSLLRYSQNLVQPVASLQKRVCRDRDKEAALPGVVGNFRDADRQPGVLATTLLFQRSSNVSGVADIADCRVRNLHPVTRLRDGAIAKPAPVASKQRLLLSTHGGT